jgi:hypothetical protein
LKTRIITNNDASFVLAEIAAARHKKRRDNAKSKSDYKSERFESDYCRMIDGMLIKSFILK